MNDRYGEEISMSHTVNVHKTRTNNQLSLTKTLVPGGKDQVSNVYFLRNIKTERESKEDQSKKL